MAIYRAILSNIGLQKNKQTKKNPHNLNHSD